MPLTQFKVRPQSLTGNISTDWPNMHAAALNATDNAAYIARVGTKLSCSLDSKPLSPA